MKKICIILLFITICSCRETTVSYDRFREIVDSGKADIAKNIIADKLSEAIETPTKVTVKDFWKFAEYYYIRMFEQCVVDSPETADACLYDIMLIPEIGLKPQENDYLSLFSDTDMEHVAYCLNTQHYNNLCDSLLKIALLLKDYNSVKRIIYLYRPDYTLSEGYSGEVSISNTSKENAETIYYEQGFSK